MSQNVMIRNIDRQANQRKCLRKVHAPYEDSNNNKKRRCLLCGGLEFQFRSDLSLLVRVFRVLSGSPLCGVESLGTSATASGSLRPPYKLECITQNKCSQLNGEGHPGFRVVLACWSSVTVNVSEVIFCFRPNAGFRTLF